MKHAVLTGLFIFIQALPTTPQKSVSDPSGKSNSAQAQAKDATGPSAQPQTRENVPPAVSVTNLPPVTVVPSKRDWVDWGYWGFSGLLVLVGSLQVGLLWRTLGAIKEQADLTKRQAQANEDAVRAARDNALAAIDGAAAAKANAKAAEATVRAMKNTARKELRARVFVVSAKRLGTGAGSYQAEITIRNFGKTPAYKCTCVVELVLRSNPPDDSAFPTPQITGQEPRMVLPPGGEFTVVRSLPTGVFGVAQHSQVLSASHAIYFYGTIRYRDGFLTKRTSEFRMKCCGPDYSLGRFAFAEKGNEAG